MQTLNSQRLLMERWLYADDNGMNAIKSFLQMARMGSRSGLLRPECLQLFLLMMVHFTMTARGCPTRKEVQGGFLGGCVCVCVWRGCALEFSTQIVYLPYLFRITYCQAGKVKVIRTGQDEAYQ